MPDDPEGFAPGAAPLCVFCSKPWSEEMMRVEEDSTSFESCGWSHATLEIKCDGCGKLIYSKEIVSRDW